VKEEVYEGYPVPPNSPEWVIDEGWQLQDLSNLDDLAVDLDE
jgi:hypothetical protein